MLIPHGGDHERRIVERTEDRFGEAQCVALQKSKLIEHDHTVLRKPHRIGKAIKRFRKSNALSFTAKTDAVFRAELFRRTVRMNIDGAESVRSGNFLLCQKAVDRDGDCFDQRTDQCGFTDAVASDDQNMTHKNLSCKTMKSCRSRQLFYGSRIHSMTTVCGISSGSE